MGKGPHYHFKSSLVAEAVAAASITGNSAGTAVTIVTTTTDHKFCMVTNSLNQDVWLTYDGTKAVWLPAGTPCAIDLSPNMREFNSGKIIGVYYDTAQPTTGKIAVTVS